MFVFADISLTCQTASFSFENESQAEGKWSKVKLVLNFISFSSAWSFFSFVVEKVVLCFEFYLQKGYDHLERGELDQALSCSKNCQKLSSENFKNTDCIKMISLENCFKAYELIMNCMTKSSCAKCQEAEYLYYFHNFLEIHKCDYFDWDLRLKSGSFFEKVYGDLQTFYNSLNAPERINDIRNRRGKEYKKFVLVS